MNIIVAVTGQTGAGKTTLVEQFGQLGWRTLHTGDIFRNSGHGQQALTQNGLTDTSIDAVIQRSLHSLLDPSPQSLNINLVAVEAIPRSVVQIQWLIDLKLLGNVVIPVVMLADKQVRISRVRGRDLCKRRLAIDEQKLDREEDAIAGIWDSMASHFQILNIDTTHQRPDPSNIASTALPTLQQHALNLFNRKTGHADDPVGDAGTRMLHHVCAELSELVHAHEDKLDKNMLIEELVDTLWFLLLYAEKMGVPARTIANTYLQKKIVNDHRHNTGAKPHAWSINHPETPVNPGAFTTDTHHDQPITADK